MIEQLPCASCTALCCGPVTIKAARLALIREHLRHMPGEERKRLARQKRGPMVCGFLDKASYRCTIYKVRPFVCEAFGRTEGMMCSVVGHLVQILPTFTVDKAIEKENASPLVGVSHKWDWATMDFTKPEER